MFEDLFCLLIEKKELEMNVEPMTRIELVTSSLPWMCSTD